MNSILFNNSLLLIVSITSFIFPCVSYGEAYSDAECSMVTAKYSELLFSYDRELQKRRNNILVGLNNNIKSIESRQHHNKNANYYYCLYSLNVMANKFDIGYLNLKKHMALVEPDPVLYYLSSQLSYKLGYFNESKRDINLAIELENALPHYFYQRALINFKLNQYQLVVDDIDKEIELRDKDTNIDTDLHFIRGKALINIGKYNEAIKSFQENLHLFNTLFPCREGDYCYLVDRVENYKQLIKAYCLMDNTKKSVETFKQAMRYKPKLKKPICKPEQNQGVTAAQHK